MSVHTIPLICRRGHVISYATGRPDPKAFCSDCGAPGISKCPSCAEPILGPEDAADAYGNLDVEGWSPPMFCQACGAAFPWVDRRARIYQLENLLQGEGLDTAIELRVREQLEQLARNDLTEDEERQRWERVRKLAPNVIESGRAILVDVMSKSVSDALGLR